MESSRAPFLPLNKENSTQSQQSIIAPELPQEDITKQSVGSVTKREEQYKEFISQAKEEYTK